MKKIIFRSMILFLGLVALCPYVFSVELTYQFTKGEEFKYSFVTNIAQTIVQEDSVNPVINVTEAVTMTFTEKVEDIVNPTMAEFSTTFNSITAQTQIAENTYSYDSSSGQPPGNYFSPLASIINKVIYTVMTNKGHVTQVDGIKQMQDSMIAAAETGSTIKDSYDADQTANNLLAALNWHFPDGDIAINDSWARQMTLPFPQTGSLNMDIIFTLSGIETVDSYECAKITFSLTIEAQPAASVKILSVDGSDVDVQNEIYGSGQGTLYFAYQEGLLVKSNMSLSLMLNTAMSMIIKERPFFSSYNTNSIVTQTLTLTQHTTP